MHLKVTALSTSKLPLWLLGWWLLLNGINDLSFFDVQCTSLAIYFMPKSGLFANEALFLVDILLSVEVEWLILV